MAANRALALLIAASAILLAIGVTLEKGESHDASGSGSAAVIDVAAVLFLATEAKLAFRLASRRTETA